MTTRRRPEGSVRAQESFASSREFAAGILGNLARKAIGTIKDAEVRSILWWIQKRSWDDGGLEALAQAMVASCREDGTDALPQKLTPRGQWADGYRLARAVGVSEENEPNPYGEGPDQEPDLDRVVELLERFCTDPAATHGHEGRQNWWAAFAPILQKLRTEETADAPGSIAQTTVSRVVWESLEAVNSSRLNALLYGPPLTGKGTAAAAWCRYSGGKARLVETPVGNDLGALVKSVARAIGTASATSLKTPQVEERVLATLAGSDLVLVFNHAERLWPSGDIRQSHPRRIEWLIDLLGGPSAIPVALVSSQDWGKSLLRFRESAEWTVRHFEGLLSLVKRLPDSPDEEDLERIVRLHCPNVSQATAKALRSLGGLPARGLAGMMSAIRHAAAVAASEGRPAPTSRDFAAAIKNALSADAGLAELSRVAAEGASIESSGLAPRDLAPDRESDRGLPGARFGLQTKRQSPMREAGEYPECVVTPGLNGGRGGDGPDLSAAKISPEPVEGPEVFAGQVRKS